MIQTELYQSRRRPSVLKKLSDLPAEYLIQTVRRAIDDFLSSLGKEAGKQANNRKKTLKLAGSWKDMSEEDFQDYLKHAKESGNEGFGRVIDL